MLFGSAALFALLVAGGAWSSVRPSPCPWDQSARCGRPLAAPLPALDLRQMATAQSSTTDLLRRKLPLEVKSVKVCGASGYSRDTILEWIYRYARQARLVDGADEVHKMVLARAYAAEGIDYWRWGA